MFISYLNWFFPHLQCSYSILLKYYWVYLFILLSVFPSHICWFNFFKFVEFKYAFKSQNYTKRYIWRPVTPSYSSSTPFLPPPTLCRYSDLFSSLSVLYFFAKISKHIYMFRGYIYISSPPQFLTGKIV